MKNIIICLILISGIPAYSTVRNVPSPYLTIQSALSACVAGDTVMVQPGTYPENIIWPSVNSIKLLGSGSFVTYISGFGSGRVVMVNSPSIDTTTEITGFTLIDGILMGGNSAYGAGIYVEDCSVKMTDLLIMGNRIFVPGGHGSGAGMYLKNSASIVQNCFIIANSIDSSTWGHGGGVFVEEGSPKFRNVTISDNLNVSDIWCYGAGIYVSDASAIELREVKITGNQTGNSSNYYYGTGLYLNNVPNADLYNVLVAMNRSGTGGSFNQGGGIFCDGDTTNVNMVNVTIAENTKIGNATIDGSGIFVRDATVFLLNSISYNPNPGTETGTSGAAMLAMLWSDVRGGYPGLQNINVIPGFVTSTDFHLLPNSPCAGTATQNGATFIDLDGNPRPMPSWSFDPDMGCYEVDESLTGIGEPGISETLVYPNPTTPGSWITIPECDEETYVVDATGRIVSVYPANLGSKILIGDLAPGIYLLQQQLKPAIRLVVVNEK